jgi:hypothetical protein
MSKRKANSESKQITKKPRPTEETPYVHSCVFDGTLVSAKCHSHQATVCLKKGLALFHAEFHNKEVQLINEQIMLGPVLSRDPQRIVCSYTKPSCQIASMFSRASSRFSQFAAHGQILKLSP